jgi:tetratricopeptide (TPR) repeat protein
MRVVLLSVGVAALFVIAAPLSVHAQTKQQVDWCVDDDNAFAPDLRINGCTAVIQSGNSSGKRLAWAFNNRGNAYHAKGDNDHAIAEYNQALQLDPSYAIAYNSRGNAYHDKGDNDLAIADYNRALQLDPNLTAAYNGRANAYAAKGNYAFALADYTTVIKIEPSADSFNGRCWVRALLGQDLQGALADCNEALRRRANDPNVLNSRGLVELKLGQYDQAIADYGAAIAQNPSDAASLYGRGIAKLRRGDRAGARADFAAAKKIKLDIAAIYAGFGIK